jgi:hypothetical protein
MQSAGLERTDRVASGGRVVLAGGVSAGRLAGAAVALLGVLVALGGMAQVGITVKRAQDQARVVGTTAQMQRFAFDRGAWQAIPVDELFPPTYTTRSASPKGNAVHTFTRIAVAPPAGCGASLDPALVALLSEAGCGPVLRADYADATQSMVATVGLVVIHGTPAQQSEVAQATVSNHDDLRPRALTAPGTAAAAFGDPQRLTHEVHANPDHPYLFFAVAGLADGRPAGADVGPEVVQQSGTDLMAANLEGLVARLTVAAIDGRWVRRPR